MNRRDVDARADRSRTASSSRPTSSTLIVSWANTVRDRFSRSEAASHSRNRASRWARSRRRGGMSARRRPSAPQQQPLDHRLEHLVACSRAPAPRRPASCGSPCACGAALRARSRRSGCRGRSRSATRTVFARLAVAVDAALALLVAGRVPAQVVVDDRVEVVLEVDALATGSRCRPARVSGPAPAGALAPRARRRQRPVTARPRRPWQPRRSSRARYSAVGMKRQKTIGRCPSWSSSATSLTAFWSFSSAVAEEVLGLAGHVASRRRRVAGRLAVRLARVARRGRRRAARPPRRPPGRARSAGRSRRRPRASRVGHGGTGTQGRGGRRRAGGQRPQQRQRRPPAHPLPGRVPLPASATVSRA